MAIINSYSEDTPAVNDLLVGTKVNATGNATKNFKISDLSDFINLGNTLQTVTDNGNIKTLIPGDVEGMVINLSASPTVQQRGIKINMPVQTTASFSNPDCFVASINGQNPASLPNYVSGFYAIVESGSDNYSLISEHKVGVTTSTHFVGKNYAGVTSDFAYFSEVGGTMKFRVDSSGSIFTEGDVVLKSPNGTAYKITVSDAGVLVVTAV